MVRVLPRDLKTVGDIRQLTGKEIRIIGTIRRWKDGTEIVLRNADQLNGPSMKLLATPKVYDAERQSLKGFKGKDTTRRSRKRVPNQSNDPWDTQ